MLESLKPIGFLAGRLLLSLIFLLSGAMKIFNWSKTAQHMTEQGMPAADVLLFLAIVLELGGGLSILLGCKARLGALALVVFLIPATLIFHDFWTFEGEAVQMQMQHFMKNLAILGGLLTLAAAGPGPISFDARISPTETTNRATREEMTPAHAR